MKDGIGVPLMPVEKRIKMSSASLPPLIFHGKVTLRMRMGKPQSSLRSNAFWPLPRPSLPWHSQHLARSKTSRPLATSPSLEAGRLAGNDTIFL